VFYQPAAAPPPAANYEVPAAAGRLLTKDEAAVVIGEVVETFGLEAVRGRETRAQQRGHWHTGNPPAEPGAKKETPKNPARASNPPAEPGAFSDDALVDLLAEAIASVSQESNPRSLGRRAARASASGNLFGA
jgi:hypothetical protein